MDGNLKIISAVILVLASGLVTASMFQGGSGGTFDLDTADQLEGVTEMKSFTSMEEINDFISGNEELRDNPDLYRYLDLDRYYGGNPYDRNYYADSDSAPSLTLEAGSSNKAKSSDHSTTNVQEQGVDEGDVVKNDGEYAYVVSKDASSVVISRVSPASRMKVLSEIHVEGAIQEIYLKDNKLLVIEESRERIGNNYKTSVEVSVFDITRRSSPVLIREDKMEGGFETSRMIGNRIHFIGRNAFSTISGEDQLPAPPSRIHYIDEYDDRYMFTNIGTFDITDLRPMELKSMILGFSTEIYVSTNNIYLTHQRRMSWLEQKEMETKEVLIPLLPPQEATEIENILESDGSLKERMASISEIMETFLVTSTSGEVERFQDDWEEQREPFLERLAPMLERTAIHRIYIGNGDVTFTASGDVPGYILNRFSMGEYNGHFGIATTTGHVSRRGRGDAQNHLYVLNMEMEITGSITGIAPGERIYSARFMGERAYLVTFDKVDPFFVIDLSDPMSPEILGELKIPGYSDYLHPYDENHVIGLGKETVLAEGGEFSWYQGVKLSFFDVTDVNYPREVSKYIIGDRGTSSTAQFDPHAFLFSLSKNLVVIPISLYEIDYTIQRHVEPNTRGQYVWEGAYVLHISVEDGFRLKGRISHSYEVDPSNDDSYARNSMNRIYRSFYINDVIFTVSTDMIMATDMDSMAEVGKLEIDITNDDRYN